jgi:hypothetical protein
MDNMQRVAKTDLPKGPAGPIDFDEIVRAPRRMRRWGRAKPPVHRLRQPVDAAAGAQAIDRRYRARWRRGRLPGFPNNSMKEFSSALGKIVTAGRFRQYRHRSAPLPRFRRAGGSDLCGRLVRFRPVRRFLCQTKVPPHDRLIGNVSVEYALEQFAEGMARVPASPPLGSPTCARSIGEVDPRLGCARCRADGRNAGAGANDRRGGAGAGQALGTQKRNDPTLVPSSDAQAAAVPGYSGPSLPEGSYFDDPERLEAAGQSAKSSNEQYRITTDADRTRDVQQFGDLGGHAEGDVG